MKGGQRSAPRHDPPPAPERRGILFVVATPIGNLEDITLRALRVLREADVVAAEDTRRTVNLLQHYQIRTSLVSVHEHNERRRAAEILEMLRVGRSIALVSDAGTPGIADPGAFIVAAAREAGFRVEPVPGPSAVTAALSASGLGQHGHTFLGFPPVSPAARRKWFAALPAAAMRTLVLFEAPHRIARTLSDLSLILGDRPIVVVRELTKLHEEWVTGPAGEIETQLSSTKGEFVILVPEAATPPGRPESPSDADVVTVFGQITNIVGVDRREAIREVARRLDMAPKAVYAALERAKKSEE
jgi:16S rRNA (cytidine1402-2'-O)-methyltransferase